MKESQLQQPGTSLCFRSMINGGTADQVCLFEVMLVWNVVEVDFLICGEGLHRYLFSQYIVCWSRKTIGIQLRNGKWDLALVFFGFFDIVLVDLRSRLHPHSSSIANSATPGHPKTLAINLMFSVSRSIN